MLFQIVAVVDEYGELAALAEQIETVTRVPGLLRSWDLQSVVSHDAAYVVEPAGHLDDGTPVYQVLKCALRTDNQNRNESEN